jgi:hypothetical protein
VTSCTGLIVVSSVHYLIGAYWGQIVEVMTVAGGCRYVCG